MKSNNKNSAQISANAPNSHLKPVDVVSYINVNHLRDKFLQSVNQHRMGTDRSSKRSSEPKNAPLNFEFKPFVSQTLVRNLETSPLENDAISSPSTKKSSYTVRQFGPIELINIGKSEARGCFLHIPLSFQVLKPGLYQIRAELLSEDSNKLIANLINQNELAMGTSLLPLNVHASNLDDPGPYTLRGLSLRLLYPGQAKQNEDVVCFKGQFHVDGHDLSVYD